jgi:hypothetical protein
VDSATNPAITISSWNTITFTNMRRDITGYVYNDFGPSAFKSFEIEFQANASDSQNDGTATVFAVSNTLGSIQSHIDANDGTLVIFSNNGGNFAVTLIDYNTDDSDSYIYGGTTIPLRYYTVKRSSNNATLEIYSDSNRTVLVDTLSISAATTPSRYLYALQSRNTGSSTRITGTTRYFEIVNTSSSSSSTSESSSSSSESSSSSSESSSSTSVIPISAAATYIIDSSKIDSDLVNFPLGISGSSFMDGISPSANLHAQVNGTECYVEVDIWDVDKAVIWVNVPLVVSGSDTEIVLGYSEGVNTYIGTVGTSAAQQVWDDGFLVVYHMTQTPLQVTDEIKDSTSNEIHATSNANIGNLVAGGFGKAITFNDNNGALTTAAFSRGTNAISVDLFVDAGTHPADGGWIVNQRDAVTNDQWQVAMYNPPDLTGAHLDVLSSPSNIVGTANSANVANAGWTYISYATSGTNGSDIIAYKNGDLEETDQLTNDADFSGSVEMIFGNRGWDSGSQGNYIGKISEFRLSTVVRSPAYMKATAAIFNGTLTRVSSSSSSSSLSSSSSSSESVSGIGIGGIDQLTVIMLHMDEDPFEDSSQNNWTVTETGNVIRSSTQSKFACAAFFDGDDSLRIADDPIIHPSGSDFTIDLWVYFDSFNVQYNNLASQWSFGGAWIWDYDSLNTRFQFAYNGATVITGNSITVNTATWYHMAAVRDNNTLNFYLDGVFAGSGAIATITTDDDDPFIVGNSGDNNNGINGYIDEFRYSKDIARWTSNFTPPTSPYTNSSSSSQSSSSISSSSESSSSVSSSSSTSYEPFENLYTFTQVGTTYTSVDSHTKVIFNNIPRSAVEYLYKDFGVDYFGDFEIQFEFYIGGSSFDGAETICGVSNTIGTIQDHIDANDGIEINAFNNGGNYRTEMWDWSTDDTDSYTTGGTTSPLTYCTFTRVGASASCKFYSDSERTTLLDTISITCSEDKFRYFYGVKSRELAVDTVIGGYVENYYISSSSSSNSSSSSISSSSNSLSSSSVSYTQLYYTIDSSKVDSTLSNFPVGINIQSQNFLTGKNPTDYQYLHATVNDVECYVEVDIWDTSNDRAVIWVKVPSASSIVDTEIKLEITDTINTTYVGTVGSSAAQEVWDDDYVAVYHFSQDPSAGNLLDSTQYENNGIVDNTMTSDDLVDDGFGYAYDFDGDNDWINCQTTNLEDYIAATNTLTVETYCRSDLSQNGATFICNSNSYANRFVTLWYSDGEVGFTSPQSVKSTSTPLSANTWHFGLGTYDSGTNKYYIDNVEILDTNETITFADTNRWNIGQEYDEPGSMTDFFPGRISEARLSRIVRSSAWNKASYHVIKGDFGNIA